MQKMNEVRNNTEYREYGQNVQDQAHSSGTTIALVIMAVVIVLLNAVVCLLFATSKKLRTTTNIFVVSLAISDLLVGALFVPVYLCTPEGHQVNLYIVTFLLFSSLFNLCGVTYDRYHAILQPLTYHAVFTCRRITTVLISMWSFPLLFIALPFTWSYRELQFIVKISRVYLGLMVFILFFTCVIISKVYYSIFKAIRRQMKMTRHLKGMFERSSFHSTTSIEVRSPTLKRINSSVQETKLLAPGSPHIQRPAETKCRDSAASVGEVHVSKNFAKQLKKLRFKKYSEKVLNDIRAAKLFAFIILMFMICWFPVDIINFMVAIDRVSLVPQFIFDISIYAFVANALVNPLVYAFYKSDYRNAFLDLAKLKRKRKQLNTSLEMLDLSSG